MVQGLISCADLLPIVRKLGLIPFSVFGQIPSLGMGIHCEVADYLAALAHDRCVEQPIDSGLLARPRV